MESLFSSPLYYTLPAQTISALNAAASRNSETEPLMPSPPDFMYTDGDFATVACLTDIDVISSVMPSRRSAPPPPPDYEDLCEDEDIDVEIQSKHRKRLPRPRSRGWYQTALWHFSNRPHEAWMAFAALTLAFFAMLLLTFLVFVLVMQSMGRMGAVYASVDIAIESAHKSVMGVMCVLAGPDCPVEM